MNARLSKEELDYWTARIGGPRPSERIEYAHVLAMEFVTEHARDMLPCIQHGVLGHYFRCLIEHDIGEQKNLRLGIDALLELGKAINENAQS